MPSIATVDHQIDLVARDHVRRHEVDHVAERTQQHAAFEAMQVDAQAAAFGGGERRARRLVAHQFDRGDHAGLAHIGDVADARPAAPVALARCARERAVAFEHGLVAEDRQRRQRRAAGERIAGVAVRMQERFSTCILGIERGVDRGGGQHRRQRQEAAGQAFRQAQEVRRDAGLLAGEQRAGAAEADRDLVGDQMHVEFVAERAQAGQIRRVDTCACRRRIAPAARRSPRRLRARGVRARRACRRACAANARARFSPARARSNPARRRRSDRRSSGA